MPLLTVPQAIPLYLQRSKSESCLYSLQETPLEDIRQGRQTSAEDQHV